MSEIRFIIDLNIHCIKYQMLILFLFAGINLFAQKEIKPCQKEPIFIKNLGYDPEWTAFSSSEKQMMGLVLIELVKSGKEKTPSLESLRGKIYQDSSWKKAGYLAGIVRDADGNIYSIPAPHVSVLNNNPAKQNTIYRVDAQTGKMNPWLSLPNHLSKQNTNPYGLIGIGYDCTSGILFVSTIAGSTRFEEKGIIYSIQTKSKKIIDSIKGIDAMGITVFFDASGTKRLYIGKTRVGEIWSVPINESGKFIPSKLLQECSIEGLGPRADDKARKIRYTAGALIITGVAFNYNLQASSEKPETSYIFSWNKDLKKWEFRNLY